MIPFDFDYYRPGSIKEAVDTFNSLNIEGKQPVYYGGGTEIISMARVNNIYTGAVIDIKEIPECMALGFQGDELVIGSGVTLTAIAESRMFPLLGNASERIADHTIQDKITLGGNIAGTIYYREAVLPLLICESDIVIAGTYGLKRVPLNQVFDRRIQLERGEMIVQLITKEEYLYLPYNHVKRTKNEKIDYPLVTLTAIKKDGNISVSFSGVYDYPVRLESIDGMLNDRTVSREIRVKNIIGSMPEPILEDHLGSAEYRKFLIEGILLNTLVNLEDV